MWLIWTSLAFAGTLTPGAPVERAAALHVTNGGFARIGDVVSGLVPPTFPVSDIGGSLACDDADTNPLTYGLSAIDLTLAAEDVQLVAGDGALDLTLFLSLGSTPAQLDIAGDCSFLQDLNETCGVELPTTSVVVNLNLALALVPDGAGGNTITVSASDPTITISPIGNPLSDCTLASAMGTLLGQDEEAISKLLLSFIEPELAGLGAEVETAVADALGSLLIETDFSLGDSTLGISLYPSELRLDETGLMLGLAAAITPGTISSCVETGEGTTVANPEWPTLTERAWDSSLKYDAALMLNKDLLDVLLWNVWAGGLLCVDVATLGVPLDTGLFSNLFGESFAALFDPANPSPVGVITAPVAPPTAVFYDDGAPIRIALNDFGLDFSASMDDRDLRLFRVGVLAEVGIDPNLSATAFEPALAIDTNAIAFTEPYNELVAPGFSAGLAEFIPTVLSSLLPDDLLPTIAIPSFLGVGLKTAFWEPDDSGQWMGGFLLLDIENVQPVEVAGCSGGSFGCDGFEGEGDPFDFEALLGCGESSTGCEEGCDGGSETSCATHPNGHRKAGWPGGRVLMLGFFLSLAMARRRA
ncbi:hypothetical protein L6R46_14875 [Myxococcota bacterium]|nr:hypothetical protein [Myxococcota bacterium]